MTKFFVSTSSKGQFKAVGYNGSGSSSVTESQSTTKEQAEEWAQRASQGDFDTTARWATYADD